VGPQATSQRLRRVLVEVLTRPQEPVLLLLEDVQWAAQESLELLRELIPKLQTLPLLLIASIREDEHPDRVRGIGVCETQQALNPRVRIRILRHGFQGYGRVLLERPVRSGGPLDIQLDHGIS
ncbi:MAG TPA: hypothetical protein PK729_16365, partial [Candidatus Hydrogenedentes bacterium]|nr:hypothetical protein [Candidatus Hydrogenedentota bacterium]